MNKLAYAIATVGLAFASVYAYVQGEDFVGMALQIQASVIFLALMLNK